MNQSLIATSQEKINTRFDTRIYLRKSRSSWYNIIANLYEILGDFYKHPRKEFIDSLNIKYGDVVLDLCTGTGRNINFLLKKVGQDGKIIAIDSSKGMMKIAKKRFFNNYNVHFVTVDCEDLTIELLRKQINNLENIDHIFCSLGYSVMENPKSVFEKSFKLLKHDGQYAIMDLFNAKSNFLSKVIDFLAFAESKRNSWVMIERNCKNITHNKYHFNSGEMFTISGKKYN